MEGKVQQKPASKNRDKESENLDIKLTKKEQQHPKLIDVSNSKSNTNQKNIQKLAKLELSDPGFKKYVQDAKFSLRAMKAQRIGRMGGYREDITVDTGSYPGIENRHTDIYEQPTPPPVNKKVEQSLKDTKRRLKAQQNRLKFLQSSKIPEIESKISELKKKVQELGPTEQKQIQEIKEQIIKAAKVEDWSALATLKDLDLTGIGIKRVPECLCELGQLVKLKLSGNRIGELPDEFGNLGNLVELELNECGFELVPECLFKLHLKKLGMKKNEIMDLPEQMREMKTLEELDFSGNPLEELPTFLLGLPYLKVISLKEIEMQQDQFEQFEKKCEEKGVELKWSSQ